MTERASSLDDTGSLNSILLKREAAASAVPSENVPSNVSGNPSSSSNSSYQLVSDERADFTSLKSNIVSGTKGESLSGGGLTGERNANLSSILVDSKITSSLSKKLASSSNPRNLVFQLYFVTPLMISTNDICGGQIASKKFDSFCAKSASACQTRSHQEKKHKWCKENHIFIIGKTNSISSGSSDKIINPDKFNLFIDPDNYEVARELLKSSNAKLFNVRNYEMACRVFNTFVEEYVKQIEIKNKKAIEIAYKRDSVTGQFDNTEIIPSEVKVRNKKMFNFTNDEEDKDLSSDSSDSSNSSSVVSTPSQLSFPPPKKEYSKFQSKTKSESLRLKDIEEEFVVQGLQVSNDYQNDPIKCIAMLGAHIAKQEVMINSLSRQLEIVTDVRRISYADLRKELTPLKEDIQENNDLISANQLALDKVKRKTSDSKLKSSTRRALFEEMNSLLDDKLNLLKDEFPENNLEEVEFELSERMSKLELKTLALESGASSGGGIFSASALVDPLIPSVVRADMASIEFKVALLESRVGAQTLRFGNITLKSLVDVELFVNDHIPSCSYGCFVDFISLLDSLRDTTTTEKSYLESEYNAQKTKFVSVDEASTSASFLHVSPLVFCGSSTASESKYGSIERSLPQVKSRDHWVSLGGMEGMKRQLEEEVLSKVGSIMEEIPMTLGDSKGALLAKSYLFASQNCFNKFVTWTESFYQELLGTSQVAEKEAWSLILHCWMAFFSDLRQIRMACANLSPGRHEVGSEGRTRIVARYIWTMGRAIVLQDEYCDKQFRNHPTIATVINYHLFQHRVPMTLYKSMMGKLESEVKGINAWKAQLGRDMKDLKKVVSDRS